MEAVKPCQSTRSTFFTHNIKAPEIHDLGFIDRLSEAFPHKEYPAFDRQALQGMGVCATSNPDRDNYLYSLNAQTCVILTLHNPSNKKGAVIHVDHNIRSQIYASIETMLKKMGNSTGAEINSSLTGGAWIGEILGDNKGESVKGELTKFGITPSWNAWSIFPCCPNNYGVVLDLETGNTNVFRHSDADLKDFMRPLFYGTKHKLQYGERLTTDQNWMAKSFDRLVAPEIEELNGTFRFVTGDRIGGQVTNEDIAKKRILFRELD